MKITLKIQETYVLHTLTKVKGVPLDFLIKIWVGLMKRGFRNDELHFLDGGTMNIYKHKTFGHIIAFNTKYNEERFK